MLYKTLDGKKKGMPFGTPPCILKTVGAAINYT